MNMCVQLHSENSITSSPVSSRRVQESRKLATFACTQVHLTHLEARMTQKERGNSTLAGKTQLDRNMPLWDDNIKMVLFFSNSCMKKKFSNILMTFCIEKEKYLRTFSYFIFLRTESVQ
jgi:hypothetical protein